MKPRLPFCLSLSLLLALTVPGCQPSGPSGQGATGTGFFTIPFEDILEDAQVVPLSEFADRVELVPLEKTDSSLLGAILSFSVTDEFIFVHHNGNGLLAQFTRDGRYVRSLGALGRGPGEYVLMRCFSVDEERERIYIQTNWTTLLMEFTFDGEHMKSMQFPGVERMYTVWSREDRYVSYSPPYQGDEPFVFMEHNESGDTLQTTANTNFWGSDDMSYMTTMMHGQNVFYRQEETLRMKDKYQDTVYTYDGDGTIVPRLAIDMGKYRLPDDLVYERKASRPLPGDAKWLGVHETDRYVILPYGPHVDYNRGEALDDKQGVAVYDKLTGQGFTGKESERGGFENDLTGGPDFLPLLANDTAAFGILSALDLKLFLESEDFENQVVKNPDQKEQLQQLNRTLKEDDNPFLVIVHMK